MKQLNLVTPYYYQLIKTIMPHRVKECSTPSTLPKIKSNLVFWHINNNAMFVNKMYHMDDIFKKAFDYEENNI